MQSFLYKVSDAKFNFYLYRAEWGNTISIESYGIFAENLRVYEGSANEIRCSEAD